ncbi:neuropeptide F receptor-like [Periplaneta americana]|uniref:neuropeptide F receptor-like n=1 Tax=Periplaneta americana TaxID=6978 RepID=UPI0037E819B7
MDWWNISNSLATLPPAIQDAHFLFLRDANNGGNEIPNWHLEHNFSAYIRNMSWVLNATIDQNLLDEFARNRVVEDPAFSTLIFVYSALIILGAAGNSLVVCAVARKPAMRTARNMFIVNLAVSDLLLCLITMPLTLMEILTKYWPLGRYPFVCKMLGTLQATSIFVSTISITAIALDRYQVIVYPTRESLQKLGAVIILSCIWVAAIILASPMFFWRTLKHHDINLPSIGIEYIAYCLEEWPVEHGRAYYSLFSLVVQYVLPIITVSVAYSRICRKLRYRYVNSSAVGSSSKCKGCTASTNRRKPKDDKRMKRTNSLLVSISLIFCISWLPLNIFNLVVDYWNPFGEDRQTMMIMYAVCHMMGMSSACSNPLLYGWLNDNFRKEFKEILAAVCPCIPVEAVRERVGSLRSSVSRRRRKHKGAGGSIGGTSAGIGSRGLGDGDSLRKVEGMSARDQDETAIDTGAVSNYRRGPETMTTENGTGLQGDTEMTILTKV